MDVIIERVELPPPTSFADLQQLSGPPPSGSCAFLSVSLPTDSANPIALVDSATLRLPKGWQTMPRHSSDNGHADTRLAAPGDNRVLIGRQRNGASGRQYLMYGSGELPKGTTCSLERRRTGAIWTFYPADSRDTANARKNSAVGSVITPAGSWYGVTLVTRSAVDQLQLASILTEAMLLP